MERPRAPIRLPGLAGPGAAQNLLPASLRPASTDASFRRYLRLDAQDGSSHLVMGAPPDKEDCRPFVHVQELMQAAGLPVPQIHAWDEARSSWRAVRPGRADRHRASGRGPARRRPRPEPAGRPICCLTGKGQPPRRCCRPMTTRSCRRQLFPDWYIARHRAITLTDASRRRWPARHHRRAEPGRGVYVPASSSAFRMRMSSLLFAVSVRLPAAPWVSFNCCLSAACCFNKVGVRTDHLQIAPAQAELPWNMQAVVTDVEYRGHLRAGGPAKAGRDADGQRHGGYSVMVSEAAFAAQPPGGAGRATALDG